MSTAKSERAHPVVSQEEWITARRTLLEKEKALTRLRDALSAERRALPWVKVEKNYVFEGPNGQETLADLFAGRSQLIVHHFMLGPGWSQGCVGCSFQADHAEGALVHLEHHDVSYVRVARAPLDEIDAFRNRMGWVAKWVSSCGSDFNYDYGVSFRKEDIEKGTAVYNFGTTRATIEDLHGLSVFTRNGAGEVFHTYSLYGRGGEPGLTTYFYLDTTPKGRAESGPGHNLTDWVRHHDRYDVAALPVAG